MVHSRVQASRPLLHSTRSTVTHVVVQLEGPADEHLTPQRVHLRARSSKSASGRAATRRW